MVLEFCRCPVINRPQFYFLKHKLVGCGRITMLYWLVSFKLREKFSTKLGKWFCKKDQLTQLRYYQRKLSILRGKSRLIVLASDQNFESSKWKASRGQQVFLGKTTNRTLELRNSKFNRIKQFLASSAKYHRSYLKKWTQKSTNRVASNKKPKRKTKEAPTCKNQAEFRPSKLRSDEFEHR